MLDYVRLVTTKADGTLRTTYLHDVAPGALTQLENADGLYGWPQPRQNTRLRTGRHGARNRTRYLADKVMTLDGEVWDASIGAAFTRMDGIAQALLETIRNPDVPGILEWARAGAGLALRSEVRLDGELKPPLAEGAALLKYQVQLEQEDPRAYSQALTTYIGADLTAAGGGVMFPVLFPILFGPSGGGVAAVQNNGIADSPPLVRLYGPMSGVQILLVTTGERVILTGSIASGEYVEVDHSDSTIRLNGSTLRMNYLEPATSTFFEIPPGAHTVRVLASTFGAGAHGEILLRHAYAG